MKDPSDNIRDWLYGVLNGTVSYGGSYIPVYSYAPKDAEMPYIIIAEQMMNGEQGTKDAYITEHEVTIEIWTSFTGNDASYIPANNIGDQVLQIVRQRKLEDQGSGGEAVAGITGFNVIRLLVNNLITDRFLIETGTVIYKSINIRLLLEES